MTKNVPHHVAIIMDGNGRWAQRRGLPRIGGHEIGGERVEEIIKIAPKYGVKYLTLYAFSKENWQRPALEVTFLMNLLWNYLERKLPMFMENNVVFNAIGDLKDLPENHQKKLREFMEKTSRNTGVVATFCLSYSSRYEMVQACRLLAEKVSKGEMKASEINEAAISSALYTANLPDPDLLIRTSGEMRISNFLLWQISYSEIYVTEKYWPEFGEEEFAKAIEDFQQRDRRFGRTEKVTQ
jgi:undecaprenyl diphosphate synthase